MNYINTDTDAYPVTRADIETALPNVLWGEDNPPEPYKPVLPALSPPTPGAGEILVDGAPELVSGVWRQTWTVEDAPVPRVVTRLQFILAIQTFPTAAAALVAFVSALDPDDATRLYFENTANFDRDDARFLEVQDGIGGDESSTDLLYAAAAAIAP